MRHGPDGMTCSNDCIVTVVNMKSLRIGLYSYSSVCIIGK